jgi:hypothetical protein
MNHGLARVLALAAGLWLVWTPAAAAENYWGFGIPQFQQTQVLRADWLPEDLVDGDVAYGAAIALDGDWLLVGVPGRLGSTGLRRGAVYLYQRDGLNWQQRQRIQFGTGGGGECGSAVAIRGGWAAIGCPEHVSGGLAARGRVLLYRLDPAAGQLGDPLTYLGEAENERCGKSLALVGSGLASQTWLAIGCPGRESVPGSAIGAVELHRYVLGGVPPSPTWNAWGSVNAVVDHIPALEGSQFGQHLAMEQTPDFGGTIRLLVGMPGARVNGLVNAGLAFVYERPLSGGEWSLRKRLHSNLGAQAHARFGAAVDLSAGRLVVGATEAALAVESEGTGAVFPFIRVPDGMGFDWLAGTPLGQDARWLVDSAGEGFAAAVALDGDELWVGQPVLHPDRSQAYVQRYRFIQGQGFVRAQTVFLERIFEHPLRGSELGLALAIDPARRTAVISAPSARMAAEDQAGLPWGRTLVMTASERMFQDRFQARTAGPSEVFKDCRDCPAMVGSSSGAS